MAQTSKIHGPPSPDSLKRPKGKQEAYFDLYILTTLGILKNSHSYQGEAVSPTKSSHHDSSDTAPPLDRQASDKDMTMQNTIQNAGHRRSSSSAARATLARRRSSQSGYSGPNSPTAEENPRLKWDEANLYLTEQEKSSTMKINEPKTPYAKRYDPTEDEEEVHQLDAQELMVDELDKERELGPQGRPSRRARESEIPGLDIGEPEEPLPETSEDGGVRMSRSNSGSREKQVHVNPQSDGERSGHGEDEEVGMSMEEKEKHRKFEQMRKKHYEMRDVKGLLG